MDYYPRDSNFFPNRFKDSFFVTVTASPARHRDGIPAIFALGYDLAQSTLLSVPTAFLRYRGDQVQVIAGLGFGPDGLYFAPLFPNKDGLSAVLKVVYEPTAEYPHILEDELNPIVLLNTYGCFACHTLNNNQGGTVGPVLDRDLLIPRLERRLSSQEYADTVGKLDSLDQEPFNSFRDARRMVEEAEGLEKIRLWLEYRIQEPRFDDPNAQMPNLGLTADQSQAIAKYLAGIQQEAQQPASDRRFYRKIIDAIKDRLPIATRANAEKFLAVFFGLGIFVGIVAALASYWVLVRIRRRRDRRSAGE